jgi:hypothetical protein
MPEPYGVDFDRTAATLGPYGENTDRAGNVLATNAIIEYGMCYTDSAYFSDEDVQILGDCVSTIFNDNVDGQFLWNFRNELEPRWSYIEAYDMGWLQGQVSQKEYLQ